MPYLSAGGDNAVLLEIYVQPKSSKNRVCGIHNRMLKIAITAPPVDGKANSQITAFLAKLFRVPKSAVTLVSGLQGRTKKVSVSGINLEQARAVLSTIL
ncbi:MAG: YggU family protein [Proteobacteria bacterium]|nr:YggU family protein [Pseudomonadota bacterium]MBU1738813.1 YggU family protein [Pseudomonadota bacterium]